MNVLKIGMFFGLYWVSNMALAFAAEVQITVIGHGYVSGNEMSCMTICTKSYEKGTVLQLQAVPFPDSQFARWVVNGQPHTGTITVEDDTVISAVFESGSLNPKLADGMTLYWYGSNGGHEYATIALDEMVIQLQDEAYWNSLSPEEYDTAVQQIIQVFDPQAENRGGYDFLWLKSQNPLEKDAWFAAVAALQQLQQVQWAGPALYGIPGAEWTQLTLWNGIMVDFPTTYTDEQIQAIEQEYGLTEKMWLNVDKLFRYNVPSPLEAINIANRLHESGKVNNATPAISERHIPTSAP